ncbi:MAG: putative bifunctional diguanylate cyclase/phosphodiesterase [Erythrobacter sp.]
MTARRAAPRRAAAAPESALISGHERLALLDEVERCGLGWFWASDARGHLTYLSAALAERIGMSACELIGQPLTSLFVPADHDREAKPLALMLGAHKAFAGVAVRAALSSRRMQDGAVLRLAGQPIFSEDGSFRGFRGTGADITEEFRREEETARLAKYDSLTGLSNRHRMAHQIEVMLTAFKAARRNCAVMMLDLDRFKQVNDTLGHAAGDELLRQVADRLKRAVDRDCEIGRLGGDEFQVLLPDVDDRGELGEMAMRIITMLRQPYSLNEGRCVIGASVGIAIAPHDGVSREEIVRAADLALYAAKNSGRGQYRFFSGELENETIFRRRLEENLGLALRNDELFLRFEPIIDSGTGYVRKLEAHICWQHSQRGEIDEVEFASILQGSGHLCEVGLWAIRKACHQAAGWPEALQVAVNVPVALFILPDFVDEVAQALLQAGIAAERLDLEISEAVFLEDSVVVERAMTGLARLGVRLTLDEFGSGFSSLSYLRRAPFGAVKIDHKLITAADGDATGDLALVRAIVALAGALEMTTIAGGIETSALLGALKAAGVGLLQGPIYCEPLDETALGETLADGAWQIEPSAARRYRARRRTVFRRIHVIHDDHSYEVTLRNLSRSGALIQGLADVPKGTQFVVDLGGGQLAVATVIRSSGDTQGLEFEQPLIDDGAGGLCTRHRVSPYALAAAGAPLSALAPGSYGAMPGGMLGQGGSAPQFAYAAANRHEAA